MKKSTTREGGESDVLLFVQKERGILMADLSEAVAALKMAAVIMKDPDDRLGFREMWEEKCQEVWNKYYGRINHGRGSVSPETRHKDWIGD